MPQKKFLRVKTFVLPGADISNNRIQQELEFVKEVWSSPNYKLEIKLLTGQPIELNENIAGKDASCGENPSTEYDAFINKVANYSDVPIKIVYISGDHLGGDDSVGCTYTRIIGDPKRRMTSVICVSDFPNNRKQCLAHEIGHALFKSYNRDTNKIDDRHPGGVHDSDPNNIMFSGGNIGKSTLRDDQRKLAFQSSYLLDDPECLFRTPEVDLPFGNSIGGDCLIPIDDEDK